MASPSSPPPARDPRRLPLVEPAASETPTTCPSNQYLWDEEIELVQAVQAIKRRVRLAREQGDGATIDRLREEFRALDARREAVRRKRLDSLGLFDYD